jgi:phage tail tape-measure protein
LASRGARAATGLASRATSLIRPLGRLGGVVAVAGSALQVYQTYRDAKTRDEKVQGYGGALGALAGGLLGAKGGAATGAMIGAFAGPVGLAVGGVVGGLIGGAAGAYAGEKVLGFAAKSMFGDHQPAPQAPPPQNDLTALVNRAPAPNPALAPAAPPAPAIHFAPSINVTVQGDVKDPAMVARALLPYLQRQLSELRAQQERAALFDGIHV